MSDFTVTVKGALELAVKFEGAAQHMADARAIVGTNLGYAKPVHDGSKPHLIRPKAGKKALFWPGARHPVRVVRHPGNKANPFLANALTAQRGAVIKVLETRVAQIVAGNGGTAQQAVMAGAYIVLRDAMARAPVGKVNPGTLRRSLHAEPG